MHKFSFSPIIPLEFDASISYIERIMLLCKKLKAQGMAINEIADYLDELNISKQIQDEVFRQFTVTEDLRSTLLRRKILIVGDSYTAGSGLTNPDSVYWRLIQNKGYDITALSSPGGGFVAVGQNGTFYNLVYNYTGEDRNEFTDVFILGGINDSYQSLQDLHTQIETTVNYIHSTYINAKVHIGYISQTHRISDGGCNYENVMLTKQAYREHCLGAKCCYINNAEFMLKQFGLLQSDGVHPNEIGHRLIANYLISYIENYNLSVKRYADNITLNYSDSIASGAFNVSQIVDNNNFTIYQPTNSVYVVNNVAFTCNGHNALVMGDMIASLMFGQANGLNMFGPFNAIVTGSISYGTSESSTNTITETVPFALRIVGMTVMLAPLKLKSASEFDTVYIRQINLTPWSVTVPSDMI